MPLDDLDSELERRGHRFVRFPERAAREWAGSRKGSWRIAGCGPARPVVWEGPG